MRVWLLACAAVVVWVGMNGAAQAQENFAKEKTFQVDRSIPKEGLACIECHREESPGIFLDWANSSHARANITCYDCHRAEEFDADVSQGHFEQYRRTDTEWGTKEYRTPVAAPVTPKDCSRCHPDEAKEYDRSKHANTLEIMWKIDPWMKQGRNSDIERLTGCFECHGTVLEMGEEGLTAATWPNEGVGRINLDGSRGTCAACHTRHRFAVSEARKPEACGQCHLGPDHPQIEIYRESKHGAIYDTFGDEWNWEAAPGMWTPGVDYRTPTCAVCHMSGVGDVPTTHDATERLAWESQAPLTVRPDEFKPFPADVSWEEERQKMESICLNCHSEAVVEHHFERFDQVVENYNDNYFRPIKEKLDELYEKNLLSREYMFDEDLEVEYYELWHHEGRRARMGAAMMAPDYTWWHGFYELKKRFTHFMHEAERLVEAGTPAYRHEHFPGATGDTTVPEAVKPR